MKKYKKYFNVTLVTALAATSLVAVPILSEASVKFSDVHAKDYFYKDVQSLSERGIIHGFPDGTFRPKESVTRGQAAKIIAGALGLDTNNVKNPGFKDVKSTDPYYGAIAALENAGKIKGFEDGKYYPGQAIQRDHMALILANSFQLKPSPNTKTPFQDIDGGYKNAITALYEYGVTYGKTATTFDGKSFVTRGQLASFVVRAENVAWNTSFKINSISNSKIQTSIGEFKVAKSLQPLLHSKNLSALLGADITAKIKNNEIVEISSLTINNSGTKGRSIELDGGKASISGNITINGDFVSLENLDVNGNVALTGKVLNEFKSNNITAQGELVVADLSAQALASLTNVNTTNNLNISLLNSIFKAIDIKRDKVQLNSNNKIAEVRVLSKVGSIEINADVEKLIVNVTVKLEIKGKGTINQLIVQQAAELALDIVGKIKELIVIDKNAKIRIGLNLIIDKLVIPVGASISSIITNYNSVIDKIKEIKDASGKPLNPGGGSGGSSGGNNGGGDKNFTLSLMHSNDTHANLDKTAKKATAIKNVRAQKPKALLLDAGDVFSGTLYFNEFKGQADLELMNLMGYDIMTLGNHEFDLGSSAEGHKALADFIKGAKFSFVSSNVDFSKDVNLQGLFTDIISSDPKNGKIYNGIVKEIDGQKVGFFGLTTAETKDISSPGNVKFEDYIEEAKKAVRAFEKMGVNKIVAVTHIGYDDNPAYDNDLTLAEKVEGIDVIVGGHSHTQLSAPVVVAKDSTPTVIVQAYQYNDYLGTLDVEFDKEGVVVKHAGQLIEIGKLAEDPVAAQKLKPYQEKIKEVSNKEFGATATAAFETPRDSGDVTKPSVRKNETALGNIITDGMLEKAKKYNSNVIMALQNGGGIRAGINAGPITVGEVITVLPFGNTLATMELTGAELKTAFEHSFKDFPKESGGFLHVSGAKVEFDSTKSAGNRIVKISYKDSNGQFIEIKANEKYTIATNAFTAKGGDGYEVFKKAYEQGRVTDLGLSDWENLKEHLAKLVNVAPKIEGRIIDVSKKEQEINPADFSGTPDKPKVFTGNVVVNVKDIEKLENAVIQGNLTIKGSSKNFSFKNVRVTGNLDLSALDTENLDLDGITVDGEINF